MFVYNVDLTGLCLRFSVDRVKATKPMTRMSLFIVGRRKDLDVPFYD